MIQSSSQQDVLNNYLKLFILLQLTNKLYHWNTTLFARHKATDEFDSVISSFIDKFVEYYMGNTKCKPTITTIKIQEKYLTDNGFVMLFQDIKLILNEMENVITHKDLLALKDELLGEVNKMLYLLNLN